MTDKQHPDNVPLLGDQPAPVMSWSGLFTCTCDGIAALKTHREYAASDIFRGKVDRLSECVDEAIRRLEALKCLPAPGEPSFTLLARDPQAPARVRDWVKERRSANDQSPNAQRKIADALEIAGQMETWKSQNLNLGLPISVGTGAAAGSRDRTPSRP